MVGEVPEQQVADVAQTCAISPSQSMGRAKANGKGKAMGKAKAKAGAKGKGKGKSKGKGKCKDKGKKQGTGKGKNSAAVLAAGPLSAQKVENDADKKLQPKAKATSFKARVMQEIGDRSIDAVVADAKREIQACQEELTAAEEVEANIREVLQASQKTMEDASRKVGEALSRETLALAKFKDAKMAQGPSPSGAGQAEQEKADLEKIMKILELEIANRDRLKELEDVKRKAQEAAEAAKKALEESRRQEKEALEAMKLAQQEQRDEADKVMQMQSEHDKIGMEARRGKKPTDRAVAKEVASEIAQIEKTRALREKERQQKWREAAGLKGKGGMKTLADAPIDSPKRILSPIPEESSAKAPRLVDVEN